MSKSSDYHRTRIVLHMSAGLESSHALEAAVRLAKALRSDLTGLFVEREELISAACLPFAREISHTGQRLPLSRDTIEHRMQVQAQRLRRHMERLAAAAHVRTQYDVVRTGTIGALRMAAKEARILALSQAALEASGQALMDVIDQFPDVEGFLVVGLRAQRGTGPVVAVVENMGDASHVVPLADDIARSTSTPLTIIVFGIDNDLLTSAQHAAEALPGGPAGIEILRAPHPDVRLLATAVRRLHAGLVVSRVGSQMLAGSRNIGALANLLECPILLKRDFAPNQADET